MGSQRVRHNWATEQQRMLCFEQLFHNEFMDWAKNQHYICWQRLSTGSNEWSSVWFLHQSLLSLVSLSKLWIGGPDAGTQGPEGCPPLCHFLSSFCLQHLQTPGGTALAISSCSITVDHLRKATVPSFMYCVGFPIMPVESLWTFVKNQKEKFQICPWN